MLLACSWHCHVLLEPRYLLLLLLITCRGGRRSARADHVCARSGRGDGPAGRQCRPSHIPYTSVVDTSLYPLLLPAGEAGGAREPIAFVHAAAKAATGLPGASADLAAAHTLD